MNTLLVLTTLYPNSVNPRHGIFIETRLRKLIESGLCKADVIAPVPWFPFKGSRFGHYADFQKVPTYEVLNGIKVYHPRYLVIPKVGMFLTPLFLAIAFYVTARKLKTSYDLIDAHYLYPDGVAAGLVSSLLKIPFVMSARGTDLNVIPDYHVARKMILWASKRSQKVITVSSALKDRGEAIGIESEKMIVIRNGVDTTIFNKIKKSTDPWFLKPYTHVISVGNLTELKGHDLIIRAVEHLPKYALTIVGDGEDKIKLTRVINELELNDRVRILPPVDQKSLAKLYASADVLVLASSREGWPNVLLEALACNTQVIATDVGGVKEIIDNKGHGFLIPKRSSEAIIETLEKIEEFDNQLLHMYAEQYAWGQVVEKQNALYNQAVVGS